MTARVKLFLPLLLIFGATSAVQAAPLSRTEASRAIEKHPDFAVMKSISNATHSSFDRAVADGIWVNSRAGWEPTPLGRQYFTSVSMLKMTLAKPLHRAVVAVTGITESSITKHKIVEFTWRFTDLTRSLATYTGATTGDHSGSAIFSLYDDGWRIIDLDCGSVRSGMNSRPFKEEKSANGFSFLGEFETDEKYGHHLFQLWRESTGEVVGILLYPLMEADSPTAKIKTGSYDPATGKISLTAVMNGTRHAFDGTLKSGVMKGVVTRRTLKTGKVFETVSVTCSRRSEEDTHLQQFLSRAQWEEQYVKGIQFRPEEPTDD